METFRKHRDEVEKKLSAGGRLQVREARAWTNGGWILLTRRGLQVPVGQQYHHVLSKSSPPQGCDG